MNRMEEVIEALRRAPKYRHLCDDTLHRIADWATVRHPASKDAVKAGKRKLHQVYGAYLDGPGLNRVEEGVRAVSPGLSGEDLREACREILACHASTAERLSILKEVYLVLFREMGAPGSILDLACGLNPFALPWMGLGPETTYRAWDVDGRLIAAINDFLTHLGRPPAAVCRDLLVSTPDEPVDVVFLFKTIPCLEQQEKGASVRLLRCLRARYAVVSFPARTLGGRDKGMASHYDRFMMEMIRELGITTVKISYPNEIFYVCRLKD